MSARGAFAAAGALLAAALAGCGVGSHPLQGRLITLDDLVPAARAGAPLDPKNLVVLRGQPIELLSAPFAAGTALQQAGGEGLAVYAAFSEGRPAAYTVTERWFQFPEVWVQPLYLPVTGFDPVTGGPIFAFDRNRAVFGIGTESRFYSPYWQIFYIKLPPGDAKEQFKSEKEIFDAKLELTKGALTLCAVGPAQVQLAIAQGDTKPRRPITGEALNPPGVGQAWIDGEPVVFLDFGRNRIRADERLVVEESALFRFALRNPDGTNRPLALPTVGGTGPLGRPRPVSDVGGVPQFASHWHEYLVVLNPTNASTPRPGFFVPPSNLALRDKAIALAGDALWVPLAPAAVEALPSATLAEYTLRAAYNAAQCFADPQFPAGSCVWLDSQRAIEGKVASALVLDTQWSSSCPILLLDGKATP